MQKILRFFKAEPVFTCSLILALISMLLTPPSAAYLDYIDFDVLMLLFSLMAVVAGLKAQGVFDLAAAFLIRRTAKLRLLGLVLTALCFFSSMIVTNDVALLTFVPLTLSLLTPFPDEAITIVVLETIAANLGSMATPIGNPQNIFLFSHYALGAGDFFAVMAPLTVLSGLLLALCCLRLAKTPLASPELAAAGPSSAAAGPSSAARLILHAALLILCLLAVFRVVPKPIMLIAVLAAALIFDRAALRGVDCILLLTFVCFFVFVGNISASPAVKTALSSVIAGRELIAGAAASQLISNVPAALLLAPFTEDWQGLMRGVNIGGLGTIIASLASLISLRIYAKSENAAQGRFLIRFTLYNFGFLAVLLAAGYLL